MKKANIHEAEQLTLFEDEDAVALAPASVMGALGVTEPGHERSDKSLAPLEEPPLLRTADGTIQKFNGLLQGHTWDNARDGAPWDWPQRQVEAAFSSLHGPHLVELAQRTPRIVRDSGAGAAFRYLEFFTLLSNAHTARAYRQAVDQFLLFCEPHVHTLLEVAPYLVSSYIESSTLSIPSRKQHLAALRRFFGHMVAQHVLPLNPAIAVRGPKYSQVRGMTPALSAREAP